MKTVVLAAAAAAVQLCLAVPLSSQEQETRTVQGVVRDSTNGETLPFASVVIPGTDITSTSNRDGFFTLLRAPADSLW